MAFRCRLIVLIFGGIILILGSIAAIFIFDASAWGIGGTIIVGGLLAIWILKEVFGILVIRARKTARRAIRGAKAEEAVGFLLDSLGPEYFPIHDIETPYGNIDHIVLGERTGVVLIETKSHHGQVDVVDGGILINGKPPEKNFIGQIHNNCFWLNEKLAEITGIHPWIKTVLVFTNAFVPYGKTIKQIRIIDKRYLAAVIEQNVTADETNKFIWEMREKVAEELTKGK